MAWKSVGFGALLVAFTLIGSGSVDARREAPAGCPAIDADLTAAGREVFTSTGNCAACHGPEATGGQLAPDLTDEEWLNVDTPSYDEIAAVVREGVPCPTRFPAPMPPMGGADLSDEQVCAVAAYVVSLSD